MVSAVREPCVEVACAADLRSCANGVNLDAARLLRLGEYYLRDGLQFAPLHDTRAEHRVSCLLLENVLRVEELFENAGGKHASRAYWNALTALRAAWKEVSGEDLPTHGNNAKDAFGQALDLLKSRLKDDAGREKQLRVALDVEPGESIASALLDADVDDLPPKQVKEAMLERCKALGFGRHELRAMLRPVLDALFPGPNTRRPRVGPNRHWPRLLQYVREIEEESTWSDGKGIHLMNRGGGGKVAQRPADPGDLLIRVDPDYL